MAKNDRKKSKKGIQAEEHAIIEKCISDGDVVFDVGADTGEWIKNLRALRTCSAHLFEADPSAYSALAAKPAHQVQVNHALVGHTSGSKTLHVPPNYSPLKSFFRARRDQVRILEVIALNDYWPAANGLINFLKVDSKGTTYDLLRGASDLLRRGAVDYVQFTYGRALRRNGASLKLVYYYLRRHGYHLFKVEGRNFEHIKDFTRDREDFAHAIYLAVNERLLSRFVGAKPSNGIFFPKMAELGINVTGVVHAGAHEGQEVAVYRKRGLSPIILYEANPHIAARLRTRFGGSDDVVVIEAAVSDKAGTATFNIANSDQSSSLLDLKTHTELYPEVAYVEQVEVQTLTLDASLSQLAQNGTEVGRANLLVIDVQGAELMALRGAPQTLAQIDAIQLEVNYSELYDGCPSIWDLDHFFEPLGFVRERTATPYNREWGDALYVRRPVVANSSIGNRGQFGNQLFQYAFLRCHTKDFNYRFENPAWVGDHMFNVQPSVPGCGEGLRKLQQNMHKTIRCNLLNSNDKLANADVKGYFQYSTVYYRPHKETIRRDFAFKGMYADRAKQIKEVFSSRGGPVLGLHLRRGDYGKRFFFIAPSKWYVEWLKTLRETIPDMTVYIASDEPAKVVPDFSGFDVITAADLPPGGPDDAPGFFDDFAALTLSDRMAISNSTFSFFAAMLNTRATEFMRPDLATKNLVAFDPWSSNPLLRTELAEDHGPEYMQQPNS